MGCAVEACSRRGVFERMEPAGTAHTHPAYRCRQRLKSRKGNGTRACREECPNPDAAVWLGAMSKVCKVCKVKAKLPESQFPVANGLAVANADETLCCARWKAPPCAIRYQSVQNNLHCKTKETNGIPKHTATLRTRNYGIACSRLNLQPVWRRSRHST